MTHENMLGIIGGVIGIIMFILSMKDRGRDNGAQLARIEANGNVVKQNLSDLKGEIQEMKSEQTKSRTFRDRYEEPIKEVIDKVKKQDAINSEYKSDIKSIKNDIEALNKKLDILLKRQTD